MLGLPIDFAFLYPSLTLLVAVWCVLTAGELREHTETHFLSQALRRPADFRGVYWL